MEAERIETSQPCHSDSDTELDAILIDLERQWVERNGELQAVKTGIHQTSRINSEMLANMGHELAKPLNGVIGLARLMLGTDLDCSQKLSIETIIRSCYALLRTLDDIVDLSGTEEGPAETPQRLLEMTGGITALIDTDYVNRMKSDFQNGTFRTLLQQYCSDTEQALRDLDRAVERQDTSQVKNLLHLLKGCSANFGASAIAELCEGHTLRLKHLHNMTRPEVVRLKQIYADTKDQLLQAAGTGL